MQNYFGDNALGQIDLKAGDHLVNPYPKGFSKIDLKPGKSGEWSVEKFTVSRDAVGLYNLRLIRDGRRDRVVPPGDYTRLVHNRIIVMSDTPAEAHEHTPLYKAATGNVLINGLGIGFGLQAVLSKPAVKSVIVVEKSKDVIKLVGRQIKDPRVTVINADAFEYQPDCKYDVVWHDIWNEIDEDNKPQMLTLRKKYARRAKWQGFWSANYL